MKKIILAYSGGLDTTVISDWLKYNYPDHEIIGVCCNVGQPEKEFKDIKKRTTLKKLIFADIQDSLVTDFIFPMLKANASYENYLLGTAIARYPIAKKLIEIAKQEKAEYICHGCTGKGNDQVRLELTFKAFDPSIKIIAPWREWKIKSREEELAYAQLNNLPLSITKENNYSKDLNLWHLSHEGLDLEDPSNEPKYDTQGFLELTKPLLKSSNKPEFIKITFEKGIPISLNDKKLSPVSLIKKLNEIAKNHSIGITDIVENRLIGMKSRGIYETPAGTILFHAHKLLESICLDKETQHFNYHIAIKYGELIYNGQWFTPLRESLSSYIDSTQKVVNGDVVLKLYKGNMITSSLYSPNSIYSKDFATFDSDDFFNHKDAIGFINLYGLPITISTMKKLNLCHETKLKKWENWKKKD